MFNTLNPDQSTRSVRTVAILVAAVVLAVVAMFAIVTFASSSEPLVSNSAGSFHFIQTIPDADPLTDQALVLPAALERVSWGAIIAGALITISIQIVLNLLGFALQASIFDPAPHEGSDLPTVSIIGVVWFVVTGLLAVFIGGAVAANLSGLAEPTDGAIHGVLTWGLAMIVTLAFVTTSVGRLLGGLATLTGEALSLAGNVAGSAANVAGSALGAAGNVTGSVVSGTATLGSQALSTLAQGTSQASQMVAEGIANTSRQAVDASPDVREALDLQNMSFDNILSELRSGLRDANVSPEAVEGQAAGAADDVREGVKAAVQHPDQAARVLELTLRRVLRRGEAVASDVDRDSLVKLLTSRSDMTEEQARDRINQYEEQFNQTRQEVTQVRQQVEERAQQTRAEVEKRAEEIRQSAMQQAEELQNRIETQAREARDEVARQAREAAEKASNNLAKLAAAVGLAMLLGGVFAGFGGALGVEDPEVVEVDVTEGREGASLPGDAATQNFVIFERSY